MRAMQIIDFGYMQRDVTLIFDRDHNLIILFLISLRIWSIGVDVKLTQQDVKNSRLQITLLTIHFIREQNGMSESGERK